MSVHLNTNNFNGGELSPLVYSRIDLQKYKTSAKILENFVPTKYGPIERSLGFQCFYDSAATPAVVTTEGNNKCRLESFRFNTSTNYVLGFTDQKIRFYKGGTTATQIETAPGVALEVASPYAEADLFDLQVRQINDVMYITHPSYAVRKLSRVSETSWTLALVDWDFPQVLDENETSTTVYPAATTGSTTLTASSAIFSSDMVGGYFAIRQRRDAQEIYGDRLQTSGGLLIDLDDASVTTSAIKVKGPWSFNITAGGSGKFDIQRKFKSGPWETVHVVTTNLTSAYAITGDEEEDDVQYRLVYTKGLAALGDPTISFRVDAIDIVGFCQIDTFNSTTNVSVTVKRDFEKSGSGEAVETWSEGAFSDKNGHPRTCTFHQQRLWFAGTTLEKQRVWASKTGDFEDFERGTEDDEGIAVDLASDQQNEIMWLRSQRNILAGTSANEWTIGADSLNGAITPTNITARVHTLQGSTTRPAILAGNKALFLTRNEKKLQSYFFNFQVDGYDSEEISKLSEHILEGGVSQMAYQQIRDQIVYMTRADGELVCLVFNQEDNVLAFFRRNNSELVFESVSTLYGVDEDEVWVVAKGTINGSTKRFILRSSARTATKADMVYLDASITLTGASSTTWTAAHLPNTTVDVLADGWVQQGITTDASGNFTISKAATKVTVGLPYTSTYRSLNIEASSGDGTSKGKKKRVVRIDLGVQDSLGGEYGIVKSETPTNQDVEDIYPNLSRIMDVSLLGSSPDLVTGVFPLTMPPGNYTEIDVILKQKQPLPLTVTHTFPVVNTKGD